MMFLGNFGILFRENLCLYIDLYIWVAYLIDCIDVAAELLEIGFDG